MQKNICVLGGSGYVGSRLVSEIGSTHKVTVVDRNVGLNVMNYIKQTDFSQFDVVILLSGQCSVVSSSDLLVTMNNNVMVFCELVEKLTKDQVFIYASSSSVYGQTDNHEVNEEYNKYQPYNYYDLSKQMIDNIAKLSDLHYYGLRFGTVNGYSSNFRNDLMINSMYSSAKKNGYLHVSNAHINRPILSIRDLVKDVITIIDNSDYSKRGVYNLVSFNSTVGEIAEALSQRTGCEIKQVTQDSLKVINFKLSSSCYDFRITKAKFNKVFGERKLDTIDDILFDIDSCAYTKVGNRLSVYRDYKIIDECFVCKTKLSSVLDLGEMPLANEYTEVSKSVMQDKFPLHLHKCSECHHVQINCVVNPKRLFDNYVYVSGTSGTLKRYFKNFARDVTSMYNLTKDSSVLDIACNDGSQLDHFDCRTFGVDPAKNIVNNVTRHKVSNRYFGMDSIETIQSDLGETKFDVIIAQNVFAHTMYINEFLQDIYKCSHSETVILIQTSQAYLIAQNEYDSVYHEHLSFFNTHSMLSVCEQNGLELKRVDIQDIHGGSYLFTITLPGSSRMISKNVDNNLYKELNMGLYGSLKSYKLNVELDTVRRYTQLLEYKKAGYDLVGYGSTAKSNTTLNYMRANGLFNCIIDENPGKCGKFTPGTMIPVVGINDIVYTSKTLFVVLAWNYFEEIHIKLRNKFDSCQVVNFASLGTRSHVDD